VLSASGELVHSEPISVPKGTMMHDFMITREHAIFMDLPVVFDLDNMASGVPLKWDDNYGARIGITPRMGRDSETKWFEVDPCYVFHPLNAYVDGSKVVCDVGRHSHMWRTSMDDFAPCYLYRWTFDLETGAVTETQLDDRAHAFPRVDERLVGLRHRYGWVAAARTETGDFGEPGVLLKYDVEAGTTEVHDFGPDAYPGEFVFVPASDAAAEDEGWAMGLVYRRSTDTSELVILDGRDMAAAPVATVHLPRRVPFGFHGSWVDDATL
jgi:carotenoid cleavage dioxygenase